MNSTNESIPEIHSKKEKNKYFGVKYKGKIRFYLSETMTRRQGLSFDDLKQIKKIHRRRLRFFEKIEETNDSEELKSLATEITNIEYDLQRAWKYEENIDYHTWWFRLPKCTCPTLDNWDRVGTSYCELSMSCPLHGYNNGE